MQRMGERDFVVEGYAQVASIIESNLSTLKNVYPRRLSRSGAPSTTGNTSRRSLSAPTEFCSTVSRPVLHRPTYDIALS